MKQNYINHVALVLDASGSMDRLAGEVIKVADAQIAYLAQRSKELDQETRVTVYAFSYANDIKCLVYDKDVLRLPSIAGLYRTGGQTALIDATIKAIEDLEQTPELYGEHAFLIYVLTDGQENNSRIPASDLSSRLQQLPDHWTLAAFVPNASGIHEAKKFGFAKDNIAIWDATSVKGMSEAGEVIRRTTESFMSGRTPGVRGYRNLFQMDAGALTPKAVQSLGRLGPGQFRLLKVPIDVPIAEFIEDILRRPYRIGEAYYQLTKREEIQPQKMLALYERGAHIVWTGGSARSLLGLPNYTVKVAPVDHPKFDIFVQSTSVNRKLIAGTNVLVVS